MAGLSRRAAGQEAQLRPSRRQGQLSERYFDKHPDVVKVNAEIADAEQQYILEIQKAVQNSRTDYEASLSRERELSRELDNQKGAATTLNRKNVDYSVLQRDMQVDGGLRPVTEEEVLTIRRESAQAIQAIYAELGFPAITDEEVEAATGGHSSDDMPERAVV